MQNPYKKIVGYILQAPVMFLLFGSLGAGIYASIKHIQNINYKTPIGIGIILVLYFVGRFINWKIFNTGLNEFDTRSYLGKV